MVDRGELPADKVGGVWRFNVEECDAAIRGLPTPPKPTTTGELFEALAIERAKREIVAATLSDAEVKRVVGAEADRWEASYARWVAAIVTTAPEFTAEQREGITAIMRSVGEAPATPQVKRQPRKAQVPAKVRRSAQVAS